MTIVSDIRDSARTVSDALTAKMETDSFATFVDRIQLASVRFADAVQQFLLSGASGTETQRQAAARAAQAAQNLQPTEASVSSAVNVIDGASTSLRQHAPAGLIENLRGSLRLTNLNAVERVAATPDEIGGMKIATASHTSQPSPPPKPGDPNYYQKLTNLFPAEALALYGTGVALFSGANAFVVIVALVVLLVLRWFANEPAGGGETHVMAVAIAAFSFLLWATASDPSWLDPILHLAKEQADLLRRGAAFVGAAVVLLAPLVVKAPPPQSA